MTSAPVRLSAAMRRALDAALDPQDLTPALRAVIEQHLTAYRAAPRPDAAALKRGLQRQRELVRTARRLLEMIECGSVEDLMERRATGRPTSVLQELLAARLRRWDRPYFWKGLRAASRPEDWRRRILLFRVMRALDVAGVPASCHRDGRRVRVLREVLRGADALDGRAPTRGSLRLIQAVYRDYRQRDTWGPDTIRHLQYEHTPDWPDACACRCTKVPSVAVTSAH